MNSSIWLVQCALDGSLHIKGSQVRISKLKCTVKPVLSGHLKIDKTKVFKTNGSLMKVESLGAFCNSFDLH